MSSTAPFYSSTTLSFTRSLSLPISPSTYISSSRFLVREDHTSNLSHLFLHFRIFYHLLLVVVCGLPSLTDTVFHPAPPHRYFLLLNNTRVLFWMLPRFVVSFLLRSGCRVDTLHCHCCGSERAANPDHKNVVLPPQRVDGPFDSSNNNDCNYPPYPGGGTSQSQSFTSPLSTTEHNPG